MPTMSMNKAIHAAFRRDLDRFVAALEDFPAGDGDRAAGLQRAWDNFDHQLVRHHTGEHEIAWPHLERAGLSRELLDRMDAEHDVMAQALADARVAVRGLPADPQTALAKIRTLREVTVAHLDHEEDEIEQFYLDHEGDPELRALGRAFAKVGGAKEGGLIFTWLLDGAGPAEREAVTHGIPKPVFTVLTTIWVVGTGGRSHPSGGPDDPA